MWFFSIFPFIICFILGIVLREIYSKRKKSILDKRLAFLREDLAKHKKDRDELKRIQKERKDNDTL